MSSRSFLPAIRLFGIFSLILGLAFSAISARANVYATNLRLGGGTGDVTLTEAGPVEISYILNEAASQGVKVKILSGGTPVRTLEFGPGQMGSVRGLNSVVWDGKTDAGMPAPNGTYTVNVTAGSSGYSTWTQITDDSNQGNYVWEGRGIAVNRDPSSPNYGRVFVSNSHAGNDPANVPGDSVGILMLNADGSAPETGVFTTGGQDWAGDYYSPWHVEVAGGDVYVHDWTPQQGRVFRWDSSMDTNSMLHVLREDNWSPGVSMAGPAIHQSGSARSLWMADTVDTGSGRGIIRFNLNSDGTCATNDIGVSVIGVGGDLTVAPYDVALDKAGNIYTCQFRSEPNDPEPRVLRFPAYDPATNSNKALTAATWAVGAGNNTMGKATGIAVDESGTYVAVAFQGIDVSTTDRTNGCLQVFYATNGAAVVNIDLGVSINGEVKHQDTDCAWDAVGNLYYIDNWAAQWRTFSPPGPNQSTTAALQKVIVGGSSAQQQVPVKSISVTNDTVYLVFIGAPGDSPSSYTVQGAAQVSGPYAAVPATITVGTNPGEFLASLPVTSVAQFLRVMKRGSTPPPTGDVRITDITFVGSSVTLLFTGAAGDAASAFKLMAAPAVVAGYQQVPAVITLVSPGSFKAVAPATGSAQFYKISK